MLSAGGGGESDEDMGLKVKKIMFITDSMTAAELDSDGSPFVDADTSGQPPYGYARPANKRILRVARGSGTSVREVEEVLAQHKMLGASALLVLSRASHARFLAQWLRRWVRWRAS
jgi:signal recognition particle GTPase